MAVCQSCTKEFIPNSRHYQKYCKPKCAKAYNGHKRWVALYKPHPKPTTHPDLNDNYFETIDTKEKAYWLGFLYADGNITRVKLVKEDLLQFQVRLALKDEIWVDKFAIAINASLDKKQYVNEQVGIYVRNRTFCGHLMRHGCVERKSKIITWPNLNNRELDLAFLLGYSDGDGTLSWSGSLITCGSLVFLQQIKEHFNLSSTLRDCITFFRINTGITLYKEMLDNYQDSLPRKRKLLAKKWQN